MTEQPDQSAGQNPPDIRETSVVKVMTSTSIQSHPTAFSSTRLPALETLLNVDAMSERLAPLLAPLAQPGTIPAVRYAKLLAYKQGNRGLIRYDVTDTIRGATCSVFGKLYPTVAQAERVEATMRTLWDDVFADQTDLSVPQPLGYLSDVSMLVYVPAEGQLLDEMITSDHAEHYMELAGRWLSRLHQHPLPLERQFQFATELINVQAWVALVSNKFPSAAEPANRIASYLQTAAAELSFDTHVAIHKDFHYGHIVVNGGLKVIDFDEMRLGDPNFDLAHFCANLHLLAYRKNRAPFQFSALQGAFLNAYAHDTGWQPNERFVYFYAYTCLKIAKQLCTMRGLRPRPDGEEQQQQVRLMLDQGLAALPLVDTRRLSGRFATLNLSASELARHLEPPTEPA